MDNNTILKQFEQIENRIESLLQRCKTLESANSQLKMTVKDLEAKLEQQTALEDQDSEVKTLIRSKIDNLLERLDGITEVEK